MTPADLKVGTTFEMDGNIYTAIEVMHRQQPRLAAVIIAKIKNIETGQLLEKRFGAGDKISGVTVERKDMTYLYNDGTLYYFMDPETYDQIPLDYETVKDALKYIVENTTVKIVSVKGKVISVEPALFVDLRIVECEPAVAGDTAKSAYKPATLETGFVVKVPLFVGNDEVIRKS